LIFVHPRVHTHGVNAPLILNPIGVIRTSMAVKFDAPHQPDHSIPLTAQSSGTIGGTVELLPHQNFEAALADLMGFDWIWLVWWFHKNTSWRPKVLPPRGPAQRRGVFATRSPHRPNPIGMTAVRLHTVSGRFLTVGPNDLVDGTPILDIKPYLRSVDAFPDAAQGWVDQLESEIASPPRFTVISSPTLISQRDWLRDSWRIEFLPRVIEILERDPSPHRTRRISRTADGSFRIGCGAWRVFFDIKGTSLVLRQIAPGYPLRLLNNPNTEHVPDREAQMAFLTLWKDEK
jgi:tRNA-Thr(GGU) m(6)t(6)A37 methyltransferase TsaA